jgi:hypothetical protein
VSSQADLLLASISSPFFTYHEKSMYGHWIPIDSTAVSYSSLTCPVPRDVRSLSYGSKKVRSSALVRQTSATCHADLSLSGSALQQRLGAESFRKFDSCSLCNSRVQDPVACPEGHLYCRSCVLESLLSQKKLIKQHLEQVDKRQQEDEDEKARAKQEARERVLKDFERTQSALASGPLRDRPVGQPSSTESAKNESTDKDADDGTFRIATGRWMFPSSAD